MYRLIIELHENENLKVEAIAAKVKVHQSTVYRHLAAWRRGLPVEEVKGNCRPPKLTSKQRTAIGQIVARQTVPTSKQITTELSSIFRVSVTPRTVRRHLANMDYKNSVPKTIPQLTSKQVKKRVDWCKEHKGFDWKKGWFSDRLT